MDYRQYPPSPVVSRFVECYWTLEHNGAGPQLLQRIVPDGSPELILHQGDSFECARIRHWETQPRCFFAGQLTEPMFVRSRGVAHVLGVRFRPHGAAAVLGFPMAESAGQIVSMEDMDPKLARAFEDVRTVQDIDALLSRRVAEVRRTAVSVAVEEMLRAGGLVEIGSIAAGVGLSPRQFERRFRAEVGLPPKLFCRIQRFQRIFQALEQGPAKWADVAVDCGYYDQAHLIRDFRAFAGETPVELMAEDTDLARHFLRRRVL